MTETLMTEPTVFQPYRLRGGTVPYTDFAVRGTETMSIGLDFSYDSLIVRFVVRNEDNKTPIGPFKVMTMREEGKYKLFSPDKSLIGYTVGHRLNKVDVKLFDSKVSTSHVSFWMKEFNVPKMVADWLVELMFAEGFTIGGGFEQLLDTLNDMMGIASAKDIQPKLQVVWPDFDKDAKKIAGKKEAKLAMSKEDPDDDDEFNEDTDEDETIN